MVAEKENRTSKDNTSKALSFARKMMENKNLMQQEALQDAQTSEFKTAIETLRKKNAKRTTS